MSILLTHAYYIREDELEQRIMKPYAPLGILYISGYLNHKGIENKVFDSTFSSKKEQLEYIQQEQPKVIAIYTNLVTKVNVIELVTKLKTESIYGFPKIIIGGPDVTYNIENYLSNGADYLVIGEGEETTKELYEAIISNTDCNTVNGIAYQKEGEVVKTAGRVKMKELIDLPLPNREGIAIDKYLNTWKEYHGKSSMTVSTQRGCPYTCKWCSTAVYGQSYRRRPASSVVDELEMLQSRYNPDTIWFVDDVFTVSHKWVKEFHKEITSRGLKIQFECITRAERLNDEVLQLLKESGCFRIWIGAESGSQKIVEAMDRRVDVKVVRDIIVKTNALGIETGTFIMLGYPGETEEDVKETIHHLKVSNPTHYTITIAYPIKGTDLYTEVESQITSELEWSTSTDRQIEFDRTYRRSYYDYAVKYVVNEVEQARQKRLAKKLKLKLKSIAAQVIMKYYKTIS